MARSFTFPRPRPRGFLGRKFEADEQLVLGAGAILAVICLAALPGFPLKIIGVVSVALFTAWAVLIPFRGRTYLRWFEIQRSYRRGLRNGSLLYRSTAPLAGRCGDGRPVAVTAPAGVPPRMEWFEARTGFGTVAILLQPSEAMFTAVVEVEGMKHFGGLDAEDKESLISAWEFLLRSTAESGGRIQRVQWLSKIIPTDPNAHIRDAAARHAPGAASWLDASYEQLLKRVVISAEDRRLFLALGIPYSRELVEEASRYSTLAEGYGIVLGKEIETFIRNLGRAQLRWVRSLDEAALSSLFHHSYAPGHWLDDNRGMDRSTAWPAEVDARDDSLIAARGFEADEPWFSATAWVKQWPTMPVGVNFLAPLLLYVQDMIYTVGVTMELIPGERALADALSDVTSEIGQADDTPGKLQDPRERREIRAAAGTVEEIAAGASGVRLTGWVTVTSSDKDALIRQKNDIRAAAAKCQLTLEWCDKEQWRAFANTLPLVGGILPEGRR